MPNNNERKTKNYVNLLEKTYPMARLIQMANIFETRGRNNLREEKAIQLKEQIVHLSGLRESLEPIGLMIDVYVPVGSKQVAILRGSYFYFEQLLRLGDENLNLAIQEYGEEVPNLQVNREVFFTGFHSAIALTGLALLGNQLPKEPPKKKELLVKDYAYPELVYEMGNSGLSPQAAALLLYGCLKITGYTLNASPRFKTLNRD